MDPSSPQASGEHPSVEAYDIVIEARAGGPLQTNLLPAGLYHTPFFGYLTLGLGSQYHKVGYLKKGVWYEPTGRGPNINTRILQHPQLPQKG